MTRQLQRSLALCLLLFVVVCCCVAVLLCCIVCVCLTFFLLLLQESNPQKDADRPRAVGGGSVGAGQVLVVLVVLPCARS